MSSNILILSSPDDPHSNWVAQHLSKIGMSYDLFRFEDFINRCSYSFRPGTPDADEIVFRDTGKPIELRKYNFIWHRRPGYFAVAKPFIETWIDTMVQREAQATLQGTFFSLNCNWMNFPANDAASLHKLWQLELARRLGLQIPKTLVTNIPSDASEFFEQCGGEVIYKMISETTNFAIPRSERPAGIGTMPVRPKDMQFINQVQFAPHFFQQKIDKAYELRVTVVGKRAFTIMIDSQSGSGQVDWRQDYSVAMTPYVLDEKVSAMCLELTKQLGLNYGAIDLIRNKQGEYIFLEINCGGQYLWIEERTKLPISQAIAFVLAGKEEPLYINTQFVPHHN